VNHGAGSPPTRCKNLPNNVQLGNALIHDQPSLILIIFKFHIGGKRGQAVHQHVCFFGTLEQGDPASWDASSM
jgi:hypothetical protein